MATRIPMLGLLHVHQPDVHLVDQGRGLKRLPRLLLGHLLGRQLPQLVIDQGQELLRGLGVTLFNGGENAGNVGHGRGLQVWAGAHDYSGSGTP